MMNLPTRIQAESEVVGYLVDYLIIIELAVPLALSARE
jgi:hypothetical protein